MREKLRVILNGFIFVIIPLTSYATDSALPATATSRLVVDMGQNCIISVRDYFKGHLASEMPLNASYWTEIPPIKTRVPKFSVSFVCENLIGQSKEDVARQHGAVYNQNLRKWISYFDSERNKKLLTEMTKVDNLAAVNGNGFFVTQDDRDGDPAQRQRYVSFCIFHEAMAVCGGESVMYLSDPKGNLLPYILDILRSIKFIDPSTQKSATASGPVTSDPVDDERNRFEQSRIIPGSDELGE